MQQAKTQYSDETQLSLTDNMMEFYQLMTLAI